MNALRHFLHFIEGIDGQAMSISEYGIPYMSFGFYAPKANGLVELENALMLELLRARKMGASQIVWRCRPQLEYADIDGTICAKLLARCHFLPDVRAGLRTKDEGQPYLRAVAE